MDDQVSNATRLFSLLRKLSKEGKQSAEETHELVELIETMASTNLIERLESKMDVQNAKIDIQNAKIDAVTSKYTVLIWAISFASLVISAAIIFKG